METIILTLASTGFSLIVTRSYLLERVRLLFKNEFLATLFSCPQCFGFWSGIIFSFFSFSWFNLLTIPFISSLFGYLISLYENK